MDIPFLSRVDDALNFIADEFRARGGHMSRFMLNRLLRRLDPEVAHAAIATLECAGARYAHAVRGRSSGNDLVRFGPTSRISR